MVLTRQERERLVLDLYNNQGKNTRQIAQELRMSFGDIGAILKKAKEEKEASKDQVEKISLSTQAYKLFSEGKSPLEVAIELKIKADEVNEYHKEYLKLVHRDNLNQIYEEIGDNDIESFVKLYKSAKDAGMNAQHVVKLLAIANNYLPSVEHRYEVLIRKVGPLELSKQNSAIESRQLSDLITDLRNTSESYHCSLQEEALELSRLRIQKKKLEAIIEGIQNNDRYYLRIKHTAQLGVEGILRNNRELLKLALVSITESIRNNPGKFNFLFDSMSSSITPIDYYGSSQNYSPYM